ncbi:hypothetical protein AAE478_008969 [Parahypoxylon ruwenzoriense]
MHFSSAIATAVLIGFGLAAPVETNSVNTALEQYEAAITKITNNLPVPSIPLNGLGESTPKIEARTDHGYIRFAGPNGVEWKVVINDDNKLKSNDVEDWRPSINELEVWGNIECNILADDVAETEVANGVRIQYKYLVKAQKYFCAVFN